MINLKPETATSCFVFLFVSSKTLSLVCNFSSSKYRIYTENKYFLKLFSPGKFSWGIFFLCSLPNEKKNKTKVPFFSQNPIFHANKIFGREILEKKRDFFFFHLGGARLFWITSKWAQKVVYKSSRYWQTVRDFQFFCKDRSLM